MSNAIDLTRLNTTVTLSGAVRQILKLTYLILKQNKMNPAYTCSNVWIAKKITKLTQINVCSGKTDSTENSIQKVPRNLWNLEKFNSLSCEQNSSMIMKNIKLFLQNIWKNRILTDTISETNKDFDIIFIQELTWLIICSIPSLSSKEEENVVGALSHPN